MNIQKRITILLVDGEKTIAIELERLIKKLGYECVVAYSGEIAVQLAASNPEIDLILMDTELILGIDGKEVVRQILALRNLPIVFLVSHFERKLLDNMRGIPHYGHVIKNPNIFELQASIELAFELFAAHEEMRMSEERQQLVLSTLPIAIFTSPLDPQIDTSWVSGDVEKVTGFTVEQYMSANDFWRNRLHPDDRERVLNKYRNPAADDEIVIEYRWLCQDGNYKWFYDRTIKKRDHYESQYFGIILDVTERKQAEEALEEEQKRLQKVLDEVKTLRGIIPICANCKKIRDDKGYWSQVEKYVSDHTDAEFSHGICPDCMKKLYSKFWRQKRKTKT